MAKTFDNISEASATNYLFLFAQRTLALQNEPPTPPPLNALGLPCEAMCLLWDWLRTEKQVYSELDAPTEKKALEERSAVNSETAIFSEKIAPLAGKITEYIHDHQDDAAQEDRWRTTMKRKMSESFRAQREAAKKQREVIDGQFKRQREEGQSMQQRFDLVHSKLDETIQIVKVIATQSGV